MLLLYYKKIIKILSAKMERATFNTSTSLQKKRNVEV